VGVIISTVVITWQERKRADQRLAEGRARHDQELAEERKLADERLKARWRTRTSSSARNAS